MNGAAGTLAAHELFLLGAAGALISYLLAFIIPELVRLLDDAEEAIVPRRVGILLSLAIVFMAVGGFMTIVMGPSDVKSAVMTGLGWQGLVKGLAEGGSAALKNAGAKTDRSDAT